jgi:hypothetical protein
MKPANIVKRTTATSNGSKNKVEAPEVVKVHPKVEAPHSKAENTLQKIQEKAYELYLQRNGAPGSAEEDWAKAEKIVKGLK